MLEEPRHLTEADIESIQILTETYPYFVPARYMSAAQQHKSSPFSKDMMSSMQLYKGNWLLYSEFLQAAVGDETIEYTPEMEAPAKPATAEKAGEKSETVNEAIDVLPEEPAVEEEETEFIEGVLEEEEFEAPVEEEQQPQRTPVETDFNFGNTDFVRGKAKQEPEPVYEEPETPVEEEPSVSAKEEITTPHVEEVSDEEDKDENLIPPVYTEDYFLHQGIHVSNTIPEDMDKQPEGPQMSEKEKSLMVVMSFSEWLMFYKKRKQQEAEEEQDQKALKTMWQKEKLAAALEEENDEIPETVFEMAVNSISKEDTLASEALAEVHVKQGRYDKAIDMYKKLSLRKPQKKAYFARKIEEILKEKQS